MDKDLIFKTNGKETSRIACPTLGNLPLGTKAPEFKLEIEKTMTHEEMFEEAERREKSNRVLERYNHYYNMECASLPHGTPITPEQQQMITLQSMIDALRCENLNHEFDVIPTADIEDLIEGLYQQSISFLDRVEEFKDSADFVA